MMLSGIDLAPALPEIFLLCAASAWLLFDVFFVRARPWLLAIGLGILGMVGWLVWRVPVDTPLFTFHHMFVADSFSQLLKLLSVGAVAVTLSYSRAYLQDRGLHHGEYFVLSLFALLGVFVVVSAYHLLAMYVGLELLSLSSYTLVALQRDRVSGAEAGMKYFALGALASGMLLYGFSMLYGATGQLDIDAIAQALQQGGADMMLARVGLVFMVAGLAFKLGAAPFHMWVPDVYHGAPTAVTLLIGTAPKFAAFACVVRILVQSLPDLHLDWQGMLLLLGVLSMLIGNVAAIAQVNLKRMLAYSAIAHMGFILLGIMVASLAGLTGALFYLATYVLTTLAGFGVILAISRAGFEADELVDLKGLAARSPLLAGVLLVTLFSLAGIPPTVGFIAKLSILQAMVAQGLTWLAVLVVLLSVIGAFYYLRVIKLMYFDTAETEAIAHPASRCLSRNTLLLVNGGALIGLGIFPQPLLAWCQDVLLRSLG